MQHTKFDRWLCKKYVHINRIYFNTMPEGLPDSIEIEEAPKESGARFKYRATAYTEEDTQETCETFARQSITYTARVEDRDTPFARFVGDPKRSVTMLMITLFLFVTGILFVLSGVTQAVIGRLLMDKVPIEELKEKRR